MYLKKYLVSFVAAFLSTLVIIGFTSILFALFSPPVWLENAIGFSEYLSAFISALLSGKLIGKKGILTGVICADTYMLLLLVTGMIIFKSVTPAPVLLKVFLISSFIGAAGGIVGVNFKK